MVKKHKSSKRSAATSAVAVVRTQGWAGGLKTVSTAASAACRPSKTVPKRRMRDGQTSSLFVARARARRVPARRSSGRPEASTPVITWRKLGENLRCRNGSKEEAHSGEIAS